jgi:hypothetical protein
MDLPQHTNPCLSASHKIIHLIIKLKSSNTIKQTSLKACVMEVVELFCGLLQRMKSEVAPLSTKAIHSRNTDIFSNILKEVTERN